MIATNSRNETDRFTLRSGTHVVIAALRDDTQPEGPALAFGGAPVRHEHRLEGGGISCQVGPSQISQIGLGGRKNFAKKIGRKFSPEPKTRRSIPTGTDISGELLDNDQNTETA